MIYLGFAILSLAFAGHVYVCHNKHERFRRQIRELKESVARVAVAQENRAAVRVLGSCTDQNAGLGSVRVFKAAAETDHPSGRTAEHDADVAELTDTLRRRPGAR